MSAPIEIVDFLTESGVFSAGARLTSEALLGGVSSDIWVVSDGTRPVVVKTPLESLKVEADWHAPVERSNSEADWLEVVGGLLPGTCPEVLAYDRERHLLALAYLDPERHRLWKTDLMAGEVDAGFAAMVGDRVGAIHRFTATDQALPSRFATDDLFRTLRIEPYFGATARVWPDLAAALCGIAEDTLNHKHTLVHGDVSPKNILVGPAGPVILDAETAWWGDPAFDVAFCLNHLLLKTLLDEPPTGALIVAAHALMAGYRRHVDWEPRADLERRVVRLLPALMLARVDGQSPVEYLAGPDRDVVRAFASQWVIDPGDELITLTNAWKAALA